LLMYCLGCFGMLLLALGVVSCLSFGSGFAVSVYFSARSLHPKSRYGAKRKHLVRPRGVVVEVGLGDVFGEVLFWDDCFVWDNFCFGTLG